MLDLLILCMLLCVPITIHLRCCRDWDDYSDTPTIGCNWWENSANYKSCFNWWVVSRVLSLYLWNTGLALKTVHSMGININFLQLNRRKCIVPHEVICVTYFYLLKPHCFIPSPKDPWHFRHPNCQPGSIRLGYYLILVECEHDLSINHTLFLGPGITGQ